jgi:nucleoside-diphosphate-sugar epimerase
MMIRDGKAMILGQQLNPSHWVAADDYARMVATAYKKPEAKNKIFFIFGPEQYLMKDLLEKYCKLRYPEIKKVSTIPIWMIKIIATITSNKELKNAGSLFAYFEKVNELGNPAETNTLLSKPETTFGEWINLKAQ